MIDDYLIGTPPRRYWHFLPGFTPQESLNNIPPLFFARAQVQLGGRGT